MNCSTQWLTLEKRPIRIGNSIGFLIKKTELPRLNLNQTYIINIIESRYYFNEVEKYENGIEYSRI